MVDKMPYFIALYHVKKEDKQIHVLGKLKDHISAYSSLVMLISQKVIKDERCVSDFRHTNARIVKNNLAFHLVKDIFTKKMHLTH